MQPLRAATECEVDLVRKRLDHGNGLRPWIPKQRPEFHLCATESHPLTWTSPCEDWSLTSLKEKLIKIGAKVVSHGRYVAFQMAEVAIPAKSVRRHPTDDRRTAAAARYINRVKHSFVMGRVKLTGGLCLNDGKNVAPRHWPPLRCQQYSKSRPRRRMRGFETGQKGGTIWLNSS